MGRVKFEDISQSKQHCARCKALLTESNGFVTKNKQKGRGYYTPNCKKCNTIVAWERLQDRKTINQITDQIEKYENYILRLEAYLAVRKGKQVVKTDKVKGKAVNKVAGKAKSKTPVPIPEPEPMVKKRSHHKKKAPVT